MVRQVGYVDGVITDLDKAVLPVADRGFLYGDSVYEVFRTYAGIPFLFDEHYSRLLNSAGLIDMEIEFSSDAIAAAAREAVAASGPAPGGQGGEDVYVRYQVTRGVGPIDLNPDSSTGQRLVIIVKATPKWDAEYYRVGVTLGVPQLRRNSINSLDPNIKGGNYLNNIMALSEARKRGADDCLMLDARGNVTECSNSNVWFVLDGRLVTPEGGNLDGLTRRTLLALLKDGGMDAALRPVHGDELADACECFVTSATREVMPVRRLTLLNGEVLEFPEGGGERTRAAMAAYSRMVEEFVRDNAESRWF